MKRVITLPNGRSVPLPVYCTAWRKLKTVPADSKITGWGHWPTEGGDILSEMRAGLHDRVNIRGGLTVREHRRWVDWLRDQREIRDYRLSRLVFSGSGLRTPEARRAAPDVHAAFTSREY